MLKFQVLTLFEELFEGFSENGLMARAIAEKHIELSTIHLRDFAVNRQGQVDDTPYGGGSGMVLRPEAAVAAIEHAKQKDSSARVVLLSPRGKPFSQQMAQSFANEERGMILLCGRYEGVDQRVIDEQVDDEISLGDFVLMGGEIPSMAVIEATTRLLPGVLGNPESINEESFSDSLLEYPQYTKPQEFRGAGVPDVLLSGNHAEIARWRQEMSVKETINRRPDLLANTPNPKKNLNVALVHYPVVDKTGERITSSITIIDLSDISRSTATYGAEQLYVVHPVKTLRRLASKIAEHWESGYGSTYNPTRKEALGHMSVVPDFDDVLMSIEEKTGMLPKIVVTSAQAADNSVSFSTFRAMLNTSDQPYLLVLGTGWGLDDEIMQRADYRLEPIDGPTQYNHLSVRAAAAIMLDRLLA